MRLPLRSIHPISLAPRAATLDYVHTALDAPLFSVTEVPDIIGLPSAVDITINDGFYICILAYFTFRTLLRAAARYAIKRAQDVDDSE